MPRTTSRARRTRHANIPPSLVELLSRIYHPSTRRVGSNHETKPLVNINIINIKPSCDTVSQRLLCIPCSPAASPIEPHPQLSSPFSSRFFACFPARRCGAPVVRSFVRSLRFQVHKTIYTVYTYKYPNDHVTPRLQPRHSCVRRRRQKRRHVERGVENGRDVDVDASAMSTRRRWRRTTT